MAKPFILEEATIATVHAAFETGFLSCEELVRAYIRRIEQYDQGTRGLNAIIAVNPRALDSARRLDQEYRNGGFTGPLHGVPVLLKDNIETFDMPTTAGSMCLKGWRTGRDAFITQQLREAGAIILAKTNLHEFAVWGETVSSILGQTHNPYDYTRTPGGSSGGTGAGIAANLGLIGIGTDTVNSVRSPASACSLYGLRPTIGLVSRYGIVPYSLTQDTAGPLCRTVRDIALVLDAIVGYDINDSTTEQGIGKKPRTYTSYIDKDGLRGKRLGVLDGLFGKKSVHSQVNTVAERALERMEACGAQLVRLDDAFDTGELVRLVSVHLHELKTHLEEYLNSFGSHAPIHSIEEILASKKYTKDIKDNLIQANALGIGAEDYATRLQKRKELQQYILRLMDLHELDALVYPHQQQLVCEIGENQLERNGVIGSITGFPAIAVPGGFTSPTPTAPNGVPVGIELLGRPFDEGVLIEAVGALESVGSFRLAPTMEMR